MLNNVIDALRENQGVTDVEIQDLIEAAKADLIMSGVATVKVTDTDPLIKRAIILYCKANYGYEEPKIAERFMELYLNLKQHLVLSEKYLGGY